MTEDTATEITVHLTTDGWAVWVPRAGRTPIGLPCASSKSVDYLGTRMVVAACYAEPGDVFEVPYGEATISLTRMTEGLRFEYFYEGVSKTAGLTVDQAANGGRLLADLRYLPMKA